MAGLRSGAKKSAVGLMRTRRNRQGGGRNVQKTPASSRAWAVFTGVGFLLTGFSGTIRSARYEVQCGRLSNLRLPLKLEPQR
jgi:hypothetical protein